MTFGPRGKYVKKRLAGLCWHRAQHHYFLTPVQHDTTPVSYTIQMKTRRILEPWARRALLLVLLCVVAIISSALTWPTIRLNMESYKGECVHFIPNPHGLRYKLVDQGDLFSIVVRGLHESFDELGISHEVVHDVDLGDRDSVYVLLTTHEARPLPPRYVSYNMEQLTVSRDDPQWLPRLLGRLRGAEEVWDYSPANVEYLRSQDIHAIPVPYGYFHSLTTAYTKDVTYENKTVDFLFLGSLNQMRRDKMKPILDLYTAETQDKTFVTDCTGHDALDRAYVRSKTVLNIHFYTGNTILEVHRILPMIANKVWVMSEFSDDSWYDNEYSQIVDFVDVSNLDFVQKYREIMALSPDEFMAGLDERLRILKTKTYTNYIKLANTSAFMTTHCT